MIGDPQKVEIKSRKDLDLYVGVLSASEEIALERELAKINDDVHQIIAAQLSAYVANADGSRKFPTTVEARAFMDTVRGVVVTKLIKAGSALNELSDDALEEASKN